MFKRINAAGGSLSGVNVRNENIKPTNASARYLEISRSDLVVEQTSATSKGDRYSAGIMTVQSNRPSVYGRMYMISFNPRVARPPMIVEGVPGENILADVGSFTETQVAGTWVYRVYEFDTLTV